MSAVFNGDYNQINYQDVHLDAVLGEAVFEESVLEDAKPGRFESPKLAGPLVEQLERLNLLVLAGWGIEDKSLLARHLAWLLQETIKTRGPGQLFPVVLEWNPPKLTVDLGEALRKLKTPSILLLPRAKPNQLGYDLSGLHQILCDQGHFAIITTDISSARWNRPPGDPWWHELRTEDVYDSERLTAILRTSLTEVRGRLPRNLLPDGLDHDTRIFFGKLVLRDVAILLQTPPTIQSFVHLLCEAPAEVSQKDIDRLLAQFQADEHGHRAWYWQMDRRQQLLALGLAMFDGLYDDQIFAGMERLVDTIWRQRDPTLTQFDYYDFLDFDRKFEGTEPATTTRRISSRSSKLQPVILKSAWELHRRHVLSALPALTEMLTESIEYASHNQKGWKGWATSVASQRANGFQGAENQPSADAGLSGWEPHSSARELFGSKGRADLLCGTIATSLSRIGLLSFETVEPLLLRLASDPRKELKAIVAVALAEWRLTDEALLFRILNDWQDEATLREKMRRLVGLDTQDQTAQIRATVALAASFAVQYDKPNKMPEKLRELFLKLLRDQHETVREVFREEMLPLIVSVHVQELEPLLRKEALPQIDLLGGLALGLSTACSLQPGTALPILDRWYKEARSQPPPRGAKWSSLRPRDPSGRHHPCLWKPGHPHKQRPSARGKNLWPPAKRDGRRASPFRPANRSLGCDASGADKFLEGLFPLAGSGERNFTPREGYPDSGDLRGLPGRARGVAGRGHLRNHRRLPIPCLVAHPTAVHGGRVHPL
jgi:hypothetical protein